MCGWNVWLPSIYGNSVTLLHVSHEKGSCWLQLYSNGSSRRPCYHDSSSCYSPSGSQPGPKTSSSTISYVKPHWRWFRLHQDGTQCATPCLQETHFWPFYPWINSITTYLIRGASFHFSLLSLACQFNTLVSAFNTPTRQSSCEFPLCHLKTVLTLLQIFSLNLHCSVLTTIL
jgi:hypothetical protein